MLPWEMPKSLKRGAAAHVKGKGGGLACPKTSGEQPVRDVSGVKPRAGGGSEPGVGCRGEPAQEGSLSQTWSGPQSEVPRERLESFRQGCDSSRFALSSLQRNFNYFSLDLRNNSVRREGRLLLFLFLKYICMS